MVDIKDDAKGGFWRIEVPIGPGRRRRWSAADKAQIGAETLVPGARVSEMARRWQLSSQQVFGWRRSARRDMTTASATGPMASEFVPIVTEAVPATTVPHGAAPVIEARLGGDVVRVVSGTGDAAQRTVERTGHALASLTDPCKLSLVNPQTCFTDLLTRLVNGWPRKRIDEVMPWDWVPLPRP